MGDRWLLEKKREIGSVGRRAEWETRINEIIHKTRMWRGLTVNVQNADVVVTVVLRLALVLTETDNFVGCRPSRFFQ